MGGPAELSHLHTFLMQRARSENGSFRSTFNIMPLWPYQQRLSHNRVFNNTGRRSPTSHEAQLEVWMTLNIPTMARSMMSKRADRLRTSFIATLHKTSASSHVELLTLFTERRKTNVYLICGHHQDDGEVLTWMTMAC